MALIATVWFCKCTAKEAKEMLENGEKFDVIFTNNIYGDGNTSEGAIWNEQNHNQTSSQDYGCE